MMPTPLNILTEDVARAIAERAVSEAEVHRRGNVVLEEYCFTVCWDEAAETARKWTFQFLEIGSGKLACFVAVDDATSEVEVDVFEGWGGSTVSDQFQ